MTAEKIYKSLTKGEIAVHKGTKADADGRIVHTLLVGDEEREVHDLTLKRWWTLVEEAMPEDLEDSLESLNKIKDSVLKEEPTIEDLKKLNESGAELTEEELEIFKEQAATTEAPEAKKEKAKEVKPKKEKVQNDSGVLGFFESTIHELGGNIKLWSEPTKRVILNSQNKSVMFYWVTKNKTVKVCLKEELDTAIKCPVEVEVKESFPKQYPYRLKIDTLTDETKELMRTILNIYI